jgi:hypothetical protein
VVPEQSVETPACTPKRKRKRKREEPENRYQQARREREGKVGLYITEAYNAARVEWETKKRTQHGEEAGDFRNQAKEEKEKGDPNGEKEDKEEGDLKPLKKEGQGVDFLYWAEVCGRFSDDFSDPEAPLDLQELSSSGDVSSLFNHVIYNSEESMY